MTTDQLRAVTPAQRHEADRRRQAQRHEIEWRARQSDEDYVREEKEKENAFIASAISTLEETIAEGRPACLYRPHHLSAPYSVFGKPGGAPFSADSLLDLGLHGWEIVTSVGPAARIGDI